MNNGPLLFLGIFFTIAFSWSGIVLANLVQQKDAGAFQPVYQAATGKTVPSPLSGLARQGVEVYRDLGCVYCHSQQVRAITMTRTEMQDGKPVEVEYNPDIERGWGHRYSVARDYIYDPTVFLGTMRTGPDLRNVGDRLPDPTWHYNHFYNPQITSPGSIMPPFAFLFETRRIVGQPSAKALKLPPQYAPPPGYEVVPTARADALVAYMLALRTDYDLDETHTAQP